MMQRNDIRRGFKLAPFVVAALLLAGSLAAAIHSDASRRGSIAGTVHEAQTGDPIPLVEIQIWNEAGEYLEAALTDMHGVFLVDGLTPGRYYAGTMESGFRDQLWSGRPCPIGECDPTQGTPILVIEGSVTAYVDFELER